MTIAIPNTELWSINKPKCQMSAKLLAIITSILLLFSAGASSWATPEYKPNSSSVDDLDLPTALSEDDSFNDLPFEQLRQALREEVERDPTKEFQPSSPKTYNFLIR